jgi:hypothetical protein
MGTFQCLQVLGDRSTASRRRGLPSGNFSRDLRELLESRKEPRDFGFTVDDAASTIPLLAPDEQLC